MTLDSALLKSASSIDFIPTLRFFRFHPPALTVGRFQDLAEIDFDACRKKGIQVARRPTGGKGILHLDDFTYSVVLPARSDLPENVLEAYAVLSRGIILALQSLGLDTILATSGNATYKKAGGACFAATTGADIKYQGRKICGSAQLRRHGALLQHGTILLEDRSRMFFELMSFKNDNLKEQARKEYEAAYIPLRTAGFNGSWEDLAHAFQQGFSKAFNIQWLP
ncbi:MAG: hypothetical protein A2W01_05665 [Candidatus Solincola sediminis]|uniref:BPL/LPL catalytic domain-containing protein n=1 Tax=Candidatus Solincola sediminis TaxID=1797199 RepID=A0A1F2WGG1_9ACTN|nr:MAG: hypothetical protein A2Y75_04205 [Candidatus Solincola sediminis]OFW56224.1 MAG: hypothetical protein A2W01_05665 [Candidatus Solincola sediminis]